MGGGFRVQFEASLGYLAKPCQGRERGKKEDVPECLYPVVSIAWRRERNGWDEGQ
jgi:hypothetical protein